MPLWRRCSSPLGAGVIPCSGRCSSAAGEVDQEENCLKVYLDTKQRTHSRLERALERNRPAKGTEQLGLFFTWLGQRGRGTIEDPPPQAFL